MELNLKLKFEPSLEKEFLDQFVDLYIIRAGLILAAVLLCLFGCFDFYLFSKSYPETLTIRFLIILPVLVATFLFSFAKFFKKRYALFSFVAAIVFTYGVLAMMYISDTDEYGHYNFVAAVPLIIMWIPLFSFLRFFQTLLLIGAILFGYIFVFLISLDSSIALSDNPDLPILLNNSLIVFAASTLGLIGCFFYEKLNRKDFILLRTLDAEKKRSDELLHSILPIPIADRLKEAPSVIADRFDSVSVLFADIEGFTKLSLKLTAEELVNFLNKIFSRFDKLVQKHGLEKIKTIGDAYMVAGGLPSPDPNYLTSIADLALDMVEYLKNNEELKSQGVNLRIGIHCGPVVAGVIGLSKFSYDLWGDTVNTSSRMESTGIVGRINVSESVKLLLENDYNFENRDLIDVKGKGKMQTYFLIGKK